MTAKEPWKPTEELAAMMDRAKWEGLFFHCSYQDLWFTADELERMWADWRFRWGACNWTLRTREERIKLLSGELSAARNNVQSIERKIAELQEAKR